MSEGKCQHKSLCSGPAIPPLDTYSPRLNHETVLNCEKMFITALSVTGRSLGVHCLDNLEMNQILLIS